MSHKEDLLLLLVLTTTPLLIRMGMSDEQKRKVSYIGYGLQKKTNAPNYDNKFKLNIVQL